MTLGQLKDSIAYESKVTDIDAFGGWLEITLLEILESYTALIKYQELYVPDYTITATAATQTVTLPTNIQHLDLEEITYRYQGDYNNDVVLFATNDLISAPNTGQTRFVLLKTTTVNAGILSVFPYSELTTADQFIFSYWKKPSFDAGDATVLIPTELITTAKLELVARANLFSDGKQFMPFRLMAKEAFSRSMGVTNLPGSNG